MAAVVEETPAGERTPAEVAEAAPEPAAAQAEETEAAAEEAPAEAEEPAPPPPPPPSNKKWYVVKVQSGREESIKEAIERRVKIENLEEFFGQIIIPVERVIENRNGKRVTKERKLYPGYVFVEMELNNDGTIPERAYYLFKDTQGVGDFIGQRNKPSPMGVDEVSKMFVSTSINA